MYSVVFAIAILFADLRPQQSTVANAKPTDTAQHRPAQIEQVPVPKIATTQVPREPGYTHDGQQKQGKSDQQSIPWYDHNWVGAIATLLSVGVNIVGLRIIFRQVELSERAAIAARRSARAARDSVRSYMRSERAWIVIGTNEKAFQLLQHEHGYFHWAIRNAGKTNARLIDMQCVCESVPRRAVRQLPDVPEYGDPKPLNGRQLAPGDSFTHYVAIKVAGVPMFMSMDMIVAIQQADTVLRAYGYVRYYDAFGNTCESRFCDFYHRPTNTTIQIGWRPLLGIPPEYTKNT